MDIDKLYKYRQYEGKGVFDNNGTKTLLSYELFASSPARFNDPFDNALPYKYTEASFTLDNFVNKYLRQHSNAKKMTHEELLYEATDRYNYIKSNPKRHWIESRDVINKMDSEFYGILSLTKHHDNILMWSHYADYHKGFCLGVKTDIFSKLITQNYQQYGCKIGPVDYSPKYPELDFLEEDAKIIAIERSFTKNECWSYEDEYRLVLSNRPNHVIKYPKEMISEIYLGCKMQQEHKKEIISFLLRENLKIKLYQMEMSFDSFELEAIPLEYLK